MRDLKSSALIKFKAVLFLLAGLLSSALLVADRPTLKTAFLLSIAIWSFCRLYYYFFYVIEHYLDSNHRFSGLLAIARHMKMGRSS